MATNRWKGGAPAVKMVVSVAVTLNDTATTYKLTVGDVTVSAAGNAGGAASTVTDLVNAWNAYTTAPVNEAVASASGTSVVLTAATAGVPFKVTSSASGGTGTVGAAATTTANSGPNDASVAANWSTGALPVNADTVYFQNSSVSALYGLDALAAVTPTGLFVDASFTGQIGLPYMNSSGYTEYRQRYLQFSGCGASQATVGAGKGTGSGRLKLDFQSGAFTLNVLTTGSSLESGLPALQVKGSNAANALYATKGTVGVALFAGEAAQLATLDVGYQTNQQGDVTLTCGAGVTLGTVNVTGGVVYLNSGATTVSQYEGTLTVSAGSVTTLTVLGGKCYYTGTGTLTTAVVTAAGGKKGTLDFSQDLRSRTVTTLKLYAGATLRDPYKTLGAVVVNLEECGLPDVTLDLGSHLSLTVGAAA